MAGKIGKALGFSMDLGETPREKEHSTHESELPSVDMGGLGEDDMSEEEAPASMGEDPKTSDGSAETLAMRMFSKATTDEGKVAALKAFGEACGWGGGSDGGMMGF